MRDSEAAIASAFYDHEQEAPRDSEARADDWGADLVFAGPQRRRRRAAASEHAEPRRHPSLAPRFERRPSGALPTASADLLGPVPADMLEPDSADMLGPVPIDMLEPDPADLLGPVPIDMLEPASTDLLGPVPADMLEPAPVDEPAGPPASEELTDGVKWTPPAQPAGRRTVVVTGRPGLVAAVPSARAGLPERRRPPRRPVERLGARPDRVAGWAFALGMLLILIAVGTADAAPL